MSNETPSSIRHDAAGKRFVLTIDDADAVLNYRDVDGQTLDYYRTYVPPSMRGGGVASRITEHALQHAREHGLKIVPTCPFIATYIERHPEFEPLVASS